MGISSAIIWYVRSLRGRREEKSQADLSPCHLIALLASLSIDSTDLPPHRTSSHRRARLGAFDSGTSLPTSSSMLSVALTASLYNVNRATPTRISPTSYSPSTSPNRARTASPRLRISPPSGESSSSPLALSPFIILQAVTDSSPYSLLLDFPSASLPLPPPPPSLFPPAPDPLSDISPADLPIPSDQELLKEYCKLVGEPFPLPRWTACVSFAFFRVSVLSVLGVGDQRLAPSSTLLALSQSHQSLHPLFSPTFFLALSLHLPSFLAHS